ncbi:hypothetical protein BGZ49_009145 [Haplosporangium sp. Z 27]|nr:hypothetical protein BGZ49_009145 [Haplosporangium sp. Z 27]
MKSFTAIAIATLALASHASAQLLFFSQPIAVTVWTAGGQGTVSWTNTCSGNSTTYPITLNYQVGQYQVQVPNTTTIGTVDCSKPGSTSVTVPLVPQGSNYSILVVNGDNLSYSAQFTIDSSIPGSTTSPVTSTATSPVTSTATSPVASTITVPVTTTTLATTTAASTTAVSSVTISSSTTSTATSTPTNKSNAGKLSTGSTAALVIVAAVAALVL